MEELLTEINDLISKVIEQGGEPTEIILDDTTYEKLSEFMCAEVPKLTSDAMCFKVTDWGGYKVFPGGVPGRVYVL